MAAFATVDLQRHAVAARVALLEQVAHPFDALGVAHARQRLAEEQARRATALGALDDHRDALREYPAVDLGDQVGALGDRHDLGGDILVAVVALQAQQRLELFVLLAVQRDDRLEQDLQSRAVEREADQPRQIGIARRRRVVDEEHAMAVLGARGGDCGFRRIQHRERIAAAAVERADAGIEQQARGAFGRGERLAREAIAHVRGIAFELRHLAIGVEQQKTRRAVARDEIARSRVAREEAADLGEQAIAARFAEPRAQCGGFLELEHEQSAGARARILHREAFGEALQQRIARHRAVGGRHRRGAPAQRSGARTSGARGARGW